MAKPLTTNLLIASVKRRASIPTSQNLFKEEDFLAFINEEMSMGIVPMVLKHHEDYFLVSEEIPLESGKSEYQIPSRAIGNRLREISWKDNSGNIAEMTRIEIQDVPRFNNSYSGGHSAYAFYIKSNKVVLLSDRNLSGSLVMSFYMRPNEVVSENRAAVITNINTTTGEVSVDAIPVDHTNTQLIAAGITKLDFVQAESPHITVNYDIIPSSISGTIITFNTSDIPSDLKIGDYINLAGECIVPQVPSELHMQLAQRVAIKCLEAMNDAQGVQIASAKLNELDFNASSIIDNRAEGSPRKIVNSHGALRNGLYRRRFRFRG